MSFLLIKGKAITLFKTVQHLELSSAS